MPERHPFTKTDRKVEDLPDAEIADLLGCAVRTVRSSISRALATLRAEYVEA
ncbi:RNA polymerase sigma factor [Micromonospora sp. NPDC050276]|uniref:RNA polymerase sigma factor n=1 Tax=Micromonospora sp. NPDC050276 TaxID=3364278 RepID=UPI00379FE1D0